MISHLPRVKCHHPSLLPFSEGAQILLEQLDTDHLFYSGGALKSTFMAVHAIFLARI